MIYDFLIVGAGFAGSVIAERIASQLNKRVLLIDKREHIAGNAFDHIDDHGILVHKYGPHIFHTNNQKVWDYLSGFTEWIQYEHKVLAVIGDKKVPVPFNINSLYMVFPEDIAKKLENVLLDKYGLGIKIPILKLRETDNSELKMLADFIYDYIYYGYNLKQWNLKPEELDFSVSSRVPVFVSHDNRYFQDTFQAMPKNGYTEMFKKILNNKNIELRLRTDFKDIENEIKFDRLIYTGPIDEYFSYIFGNLSYRSLTFDFKTLEQEWFQDVAQVNYPNDNDYTRITEFKHLTGQKSEKTSIAYEFSKPYLPNINEPYYPIPQKDNDSLYQKYLAEAEKLKNTVYFVGRLAEYKYYNMEQIVSVAMMIFHKQIAC